MHYRKDHTKKTFYIHPDVCARIIELHREQHKAESTIVERALRLYFKMPPARRESYYNRRGIRD